ncbi:MAG: hypothetical protein FJZ62_04040 [Chlamydiae bacterium]|nr:hypothetical protein [Chlamydiota bacterium]
MFKKVLPFIALSCISLFGAKETKSSTAEQSEDTGHFYAGVFGGGGGFGISNFRQTGTVFFPAASGGTTGVTATSGGRTTGAGFVGLQVGYLWHSFQDEKNPNSWLMKPALEFEGYYIGTSTKPVLGSRTALANRFQNKFPINAGTLLASGVLHFYENEDVRFHPYLGGAVGAAVLTAHDASSFLVLPTQPSNNFSSNTTATAWSFAAQAKVGLMFDFNEQFKIFAEYRFLYLTPANFDFGSTRYSATTTTSNWKVRFGNMYINLGDIGVAYHF